jgi:hypothetical protein
LNASALGGLEQNILNDRGTGVGVHPDFHGDWRASISPIIVAMRKEKGR